jgi:hypothetical protein
MTTTATRKRKRAQLLRKVWLLLIGALIGAVVMGALTYQANMRSLQALASSTSTRIWEDDPRWDCRTMGNHYCGPDNSQGVPPGTYVTIRQH